MNVLFIIVDALRPDHLRCYGYPKDTSPAMDRLAAEGCLFRNTISNCNHTAPGLISELTGLYQTTHRIYCQENFSRWKELWSGRETPLGILEGKGYVVAGDHPDVWAPLGYHTDVEEVDKCLEKNRDNDFFIWHRPEQTHLPYNPAPPYDSMFLPEGYLVSEATRKRLEVVRSKLIVHRPGLISRLESGAPDAIEREGYERSAGEVALSEEDRPAVVSLYDGEVRMQDGEIEGYIRKLEELGILDRTLVIITADHGEELMERGAVGHSSCSLEGTLYDENIKIPLIMRYPGIIPAGKIIETQVSQVDIISTVFEMMGYEMPRRTEGHSLLPLIKAEGAGFKEEAYAMTQPCGWQALDGDDRMMWCIRTPGWKLIRHYEPGRDDTCELYDLRKDPGERNNVIDDEPGTAGGLKKKLRGWMGE